MTGFLSEEQFGDWNKDKIVELANDLGVSTDGTKKDIVDRICSVEVSVPEETELTPEEVKIAREAKNEEEALKEAEKAREQAEEAGTEKATVICKKRFYDKEERINRAVGDQWEVGQERAEKLVYHGYAKTI